MASPALAAQVSPRVLAAAQAFWAESNRGQSPCSSVTVTYFDGPVLATDEPLHNGEATIAYPASSFHGAPVSQPCDLRFSRLLAGRSLAYQCAVAAHEIGHAGMGLEHTSDRTNVMFKYTIVPRFCRQAFPQRVGSRRGHSGKVVTQTDPSALAFPLALVTRASAKAPPSRRREKRVIGLNGLLLVLLVRGERRTSSEARQRLTKGAARMAASCRLPLPVRRSALVAWLSQPRARRCLRAQTGNEQGEHHGATRSEGGAHDRAERELDQAARCRA
jgi:hypothetical protein